MEKARIVITTGPRTKIKEYRLARRWRQKDLADRIGVSIATISKIENDEVSPTLDQLTDIAGALNVSTHDLIAPSEIVPLRNEPQRRVRFRKDEVK